MKRLIISAAAAILLVSGCIPTPKSIDAERKSFDRSGFREYILSAPPTTIDYPNRAVFGGKIQLVGMDVEPRNPEPGDKLTLTFYFKCLDSIDEDWQIFLHMDSWGAFADRIHGDHYPVDDKYHTGYWQKGEIIKDVFKIRIPFSYNAPKIATWIGFYVGDNRMPVDTSMQGIQHDGSNRVNAGYIPVVLKK